ncbi:MAG: hypothetical protein K1X88_26690 [Nannocystaceae bacterium]|nr:hypothetical protein [Nannocystaceae bacterium]
MSLWLAWATPACGGDRGASEGSSAAASTGGEGTASSTSHGSSGGSSDSSGAATGSSDGTTGASAQWAIAFEADESIGALLSAWGPSAAHVYAVGGQQGDGGLSQGAMLVRRDGAWSPTALPRQTAKLNWIHGRDALRVAVGERGTILVREGDDDATPWTAAACGTVLPLWGAWVVASDDVWVVGGDGFDRPPVMCHFDGAMWTNVELPPISIDSKGLFKLFGLAADDLWAVGDGGLLLHHDGRGWSQVELDTDGADLISLWGNSPSSLLAVGGRASGVLARYDGATWTPSAPQMAGLNGVWMDDAGLAHVVGLMGTIARVDAGTLEPAAEDSPTNLTLHAVWGPGDGSLIAVGGSLDLPPPFVGVILERS